MSENKVKTNTNNELMTRVEPELSVGKGCGGIFVGPIVGGGVVGSWGRV